MNDALDKLFLRERVARCTDGSLTVIESRLKEFESDLQSTKNEFLRNQQMVIYRNPTTSQMLGHQL